MVVLLRITNHKDRYLTRYWRANETPCFVMKQNPQEALLLRVHTRGREGGRDEGTEGRTEFRQRMCRGMRSYMSLPPHVSPSFPPSLPPSGQGPYRRQHRDRAGQPGGQDSRGYDPSSCLPAGGRSRGGGVLRAQRRWSAHGAGV